MKLNEKQLEQFDMVNDYLPEHFKAIKKVTRFVADLHQYLDELITEDENNDDNLILDEDFVSVAGYLTDVTPEDIEQEFGWYSGSELVMDNNGRGLLVLES